MADPLAFRRAPKELHLRNNTGTRPPAFDLAELMTSGLTGMDLAAALGEQFPSAKRADVYLAVGIAAALFMADLTVAELENNVLRGATHG